MVTLRAPDSTVGPFKEANTVVIRATIMDTSDPPVALPGSDLDTVVFTLYAEDGDQDVINSRDQVDILSSVDENGRLELILSPDDMAILDDTVLLENHRALIEWAWNSGSPSGEMYGSWEVRIIVRNVNRVP